MLGNEFKKSDTGNGILEGVGHHAGPQALTQVCEYAEKNSIDADHNHHSRALVSMRQPKNNSRGHDSDDGIAAKRAKLAL